MRDQSIILQTCPPAVGLQNENWDLVKADVEFKHFSWDELRDIISTNDLDALVRTPSQAVLYEKWGAETRAQYGSVMNYLLEHRFPRAWGKTGPFIPKSDVPFQDSSDYSVLLNHWPYALEPGIVHVVVWTRTPIAVDEERGDLLPESRRLVEEFVNRFFVERLGEKGAEKVLWFKNWVALQSVRALDHVHVLARDVDLEILEEWTRVLDCHR